ncbi:MAG TPA: hypothetical protein VM940_13105, partial [Chthoniobacterales bacterium]|nr:hypothetical protein [Chthoniobacterales bacterium]
MGPRRTLVILAAAFLGAAILALCFAPILIASGLRWWAQRATAREGVTLNLGEIDAPLLRPVVVTNLHAVTAPGAPFRVECTAARLEFDLNLYGILTGSRRSLRALTIEGLNLDIRRDLKVTDSARRIPWSFLENLLADSFKFSGLQVHVESGGTTFDLNGGGLSGSEMETGVLTARQISVAAPWFRKDFANVRGATSWQETRLAIGAINLMRGLDVDNIIIDLSHIGRSQIGMELSVDAFGGKLRARVASDDRANVRTWDIAGSGSGVSLAQMSDALDWSNRASGTLHGTKFTFRGATTDLRNATASIWAEVTGLTWRDRTADTVMIGASVYNREVQVEHLYIKQRSNELNFNGEFAWPEKSADWIKPAFHGDILASIHDLGDFARLFGQTPADFGGKLSAKGHVSAEGGKLGGQLSVTGNSLVVLRSEIDSLDLNLELKESKLAVTRLDLRRDEDFLRAEGTFALNDRGLWTGSLQTSVGD